MTRITDRMQVAAIVVVVVWLGGATAAIPGPNDPRYPDYIVQPPVSCLSEGSFPHPRNCSWYYRCVDRMQVGFYWTYYFECEPGTVFSDDLDQCIHPHPTSSCQPVLPPPPPSPCRAVESSCTWYPCHGNKRFCDRFICPPSSSPLSCQTPGQQMDMSTLKCSDLPEACTPKIPGFPCVGIDCTTCAPEGITTTYCPEVRCDLRRGNLKCPLGQLFDMTVKKCVTAPPAYTCNGPVITTIPTTTSTTTTPAPIPNNQCREVESSCTTFDLCYPIKVTKRYCDKFICPVSPSALSCPNPGHQMDMSTKQCSNLPQDNQKCRKLPGFPCAGQGCLTCLGKTYCEEVKCDLRRGNLRCPPYQLFDMEAKMCVPSPASNGVCSPSSVIDFDVVGNLTCSYQDLRPYNDFIGRLFCDEYVLCEAGRFKETKQLCTKYYECERTGEGWLAHQRTCPIDLVYSYDTDRCEPPPTAAQLCRLP